MWAAHATLIQHADRPGDARLREEPRRAARQALGPGRTRAAEQRGAAMSLAAAAEYALLLTEHPGPRQPEPPPGLGGLSARERELVTLVAQATPTPRSPPGCTPASTRSAPTWNRSGTRPAPAAASSVAANPPTRAAPPC